jgi:hypothetical protein
VPSGNRCTFTLHNREQQAAAWKKELVLEPPKWGINVPSYRVCAYNPTFGSLTLLFFRKSTTRSYYLMNFSQQVSAAAWKCMNIIGLKMLLFRMRSHLPRAMPESD